MDNLYIFGIGGTGARVLRSFTMLMASGQDVLNNYNIYPIILDYDKDNGDTQIATDCLTKYSQIQRVVWKNENVTDFKGFFKPQLCRLKKAKEPFKMIYAPVGGDGQDTGTYKEFIGYEQLGHDEINSTSGNIVDTINTKLLLDSLYNNDPASDDSELNLNMEVGFKGNPNIGSVVFHNIDHDCPEFEQFMSMIKNGNDDRVIVIGSLFGGTGSSGVPEIVRKITSVKKDVRIGAILVLPYFAPTPKPGGTIRHDIFNSKTKAAINYYEACGLLKYDQLGKLDKDSEIKCAYFIGDPQPTELEYNDGGQDQKNPANVVEFIGALSMLQFLQTKQNACWKYGVGQYIVGEGVSVKQLYYSDLRDDIVGPIIRQMTSFTIAMKYFMFRILKADSTLKKRAYYSSLKLDSISVSGGHVKHPTDTEKDKMQELLANLEEFWGMYKTWLDEMSNKGETDNSGNSHGLSLFGTNDDLEILILNPALKAKEAQGGGMLGKIFGGGQQQQNRSVKGTMVDGLCDTAYTKKRKSGGSGETVVDDPEFLLMNSLFVACNSTELMKDIIE